MKKDDAESLISTLFALWVVLFILAILAPSIKGTGSLLQGALCYLAIFLPVISGLVSLRKYKDIGKTHRILGLLPFGFSIYSVMNWLIKG